MWVGAAYTFTQGAQFGKMCLPAANFVQRCPHPWNPATAFASATECLLAIAPTPTLSTQVFLALLGRPSVEGQAALQLPRPEPVAEVEALVEQLRRVHSL